MSKILYLSCHAIHEYDEISLFQELGHQVFSPGPFVEPGNDGSPELRPRLQELYAKHDPEDQAAWDAMVASLPDGTNPKEALTKEFVDRFDALYVIHIPRWIHKNWEACRDIQVIWRTNGQSLPAQEAEMSKLKDQGMKIVRYSAAERRIGNYCGEDALIRFYKDEEEHSSWNGKEPYVITVGNAIHRRGDSCHFDYLEEVTRPFPRKLFGPETEAVDFGQGGLEFEELKAVYRDHQVYFYTGTWPACYTLNFIEAWMTGIPIVAMGPQRANKILPSHLSYEAHELLTNGKDGFWSDNPEELRAMTKRLLENEGLRREISEAGRNRACEIFGKKAIKPQWRDFLNTI
jgi:hypothetical protein